jgi:hypothetical protein
MKSTYSHRIIRTTLALTSLLGMQSFAAATTLESQNGYYSVSFDIFDTTLGYTTTSNSGLVSWGQYDPSSYQTSIIGNAFVFNLQPQAGAAGLTLTANTNNAYLFDPQQGTREATTRLDMWLNANFTPDANYEITGYTINYNGTYALHSNQSGGKAEYVRVDTAGISNVLLKSSNTSDSGAFNFTGTINGSNLGYLHGSFTAFADGNDYQQGNATLTLNSVSVTPLISRLNTTPAVPEADGWALALLGTGIFAGAYRRHKQIIRTA